MLLAGTAARACTTGTRTTMAVLAAFAADIRHVLTILADGLATLLADRGHVFAILAYCFAALAARFAGFLRAELVRVPAFMRSTPTLAGDFTLPLFVHAGEPASPSITAIYIGHFLYSCSLLRTTHLCVVRSDHGEAHL
jgi:hypothetical protein